MWESVSALLLTPSYWGLMTLAVGCGLFFGVVPGLGGKLGLSLLIPVVIGMDPETAVVFLVAMHAVVHTGGSVPSILFGIPGTGPDAATVLDGRPLAAQGQAGRALGAALFASALGGVVGAAFLLAALPVMTPLILAFSPAEFFLLALLGITLIASISGRHLRKGIIVGCFGLALSCVGLSAQTGEPRFVFGQLWLWEGIDFVVAVLGLYAVPEIIELLDTDAKHEGAPRRSTDYSLGGVMEGLRDLVRHRWLALRTSLIGALIGLVPGLGGEAASWFCYGHAAQSSPHPERFGHGAIEGVIAPETANNSKEGGALLPTLYFGVPGSSGMAILLSAFVALGIQPGPQLAVDHPHLAGQLIVTLVISNLLAVALLLPVARHLSRIVSLRGTVLFPFTLGLIVVGAYLSSLSWEHLTLLVAFSTAGLAFKRHDWPRGPFIVGLALGAIAENSLFQALAVWGPSFFLRPQSLALGGLILLTVVTYLRRRREMVT